MGSHLHKLSLVLHAHGMHAAEATGTNAILLHCKHQEALAMI